VARDAAGGVFSHEDFLPTLAAAGGDPGVVERCNKGCQSGNKMFKVHSTATT
jgi:hypothetical protein